MQARLERMKNQTGEIVMLREGHFEWRICNISLSEGCFSRDYQSPDFTYFDSLWELNITHTRYRNMKFRLTKIDRGSTKTVRVTSSIKKMDGEYKRLCKERRLTFSCNSYERKYLGEDEIGTRQSTLAPYSGPLTVIFTINREEHQSLEDSLLERFMTLSHSMNNILSQGENTDVVLKLKTREIPAHRLILKSRSTFFKGLLDSDMRENRSGVTELLDDDEDAFDIVLAYIYCGRVEKLDYKNVCEVYKIAHKYDLQELKELCSVFMTENMCVYLVCDAFGISDLYEEAGLNKRAKDYFAENATAIVKTEKWMAFKRDNPQLAIELFEWKAVTETSLEEQELVCDAFDMSGLYEETALNKRAKDYFAENATAIVKTEKWMAFKRDNPQLAIELFEWKVVTEKSFEGQRSRRSPTLSEMKHDYLSTH